ncbi:MAG: Gfo/Idh/MocA family oxidoreductase [Phycisphaerae bacterium]|nr:Gfo/Idh/MocA family oxidoreductase [Phycisphaerae bacterium]
MKNEKIKVAVIGCGSISQHRHLPEYAARPDVEIVAVVDTNKTRAVEVAEQFNVPHALFDAKDAMKIDVDAVSVCTPTASHAPLSIAFLKKGAHVLCEKPMCASIAEAKAMIAAAKAAKRQLMIGHNQRLHKAHVRAKEFFKTGVLGRCIAFSTTFAHGGPEAWSADKLNCHFFKKAEAVWGAMADLGVHKIDLVRWFLDDNVAAATAMLGTLAKKNCSVDDTAFAVLKMKSGIIGQVFAGWAHSPGCDNATTFYCEKGILRLEDHPKYNVIADFANGERQLFQMQAIQTNDEGGQTTSGVVDTFVDAIRGGKNAIPASDVINSLSAVIACVESSATGKHVSVKAY